MEDAMTAPLPLPENFYIDVKQLMKTPVNKRWLVVLEKLKSHLCKSCWYAEWNAFIQYNTRFDFNSKRIVEAYFVCYCHNKHHNNNRIVKQCDRFRDLITYDFLRLSIQKNEKWKTLKEIAETLPKILDVPAGIDKSKIARSGTEVTITKAYIEANVQTSMGVIAKAIILQVKYDEGKTEGSQIWSIPSDKPLSGSSARIIKAFLPKIDDTDKLTNETLKPLVGKVCIVKNNNDKLYWNAKQ